MAGNCSCNTGCLPKSVDCPFDVSANCVLYKGNQPLNQIGGTNGTRAELLFQNIDQRLKLLSEQIQDGFIGINVGGGVELYKGLNDEGQGELRTFVASESISVSNDADRIVFTIRQQYMDSLLDPIKNDIQNLKDDVTDILAKQNNYDQVIAELQSKVAEHDTQIQDLYQKYLNLQEDVTNLHSELNVTNSKVNTLISQMAQAQADINQLFADVADLKSKVALTTSLYSEEFVGLSILNLTRPAIEIIGVYYDGLSLEDSLYVFQEPYNVAINLTSRGLTVEPTDFIRVIYKTSLINP